MLHIISEDFKVTVVLSNLREIEVVSFFFSHKGVLDSYFSNKLGKRIMFPA